MIWVKGVIIIGKVLGGGDGFRCLAECAEFALPVEQCRIEVKEIEFNMALVRGMCLEWRLEDLSALPNSCKNLHSLYTVSTGDMTSKMAANTYDI